MADSSEEARPKRSKRDTSYKAKAFEKFRDLKSGKRKKYEVDEVDSVYEIVEEKEYVKKVLERQDDDWIVDDDGSGYVEDGRDIFDDDLDQQSIAQASAKGKGVKRRKKGVSENTGKGNLQMMLSSMPTKKKELKKIDDDETLSEILGELDESSSTNIKPKPATKAYSTMSRKLAVKSYMNQFTPPAKITLKRSVLHKGNVKASAPTEKVVKEAHVSDEKVEDVQNGISKKVMIEDDAQCSNKKVIEDVQNQISNNVAVNSSKNDKFQVTLNELNDTQDTIATTMDDISQDHFDDDIDMTLIDDPESQTQVASVDEENLADELQAEFMTEWENFTNEDTNMETNNLDKNDLPVVESEDKKVFRFFWWDAYEDPEKHKGAIFLFGKTYCEKAKTYVSCCVGVRNILRRLFFLPRPYELGKDGEPTEEPVTFKKLYTEINETIIKRLGITNFKSRFINKKYCFNPEIPVESDYLELRYSATDPRIEMPVNPAPKTFSRIFGTNSSYLELLLLERKIKGPCWLDINNPVTVPNPVSWCKFEINCMNPVDLVITKTEKPLPPPPLVIAAINMRTSVNPKDLSNEIVMMSCLVQTRYAVDKQSPDPPFQQHFCVFTNPRQQIFPLNLYDALTKYKATKVQKVDSEKGLLNCFISLFSTVDPDLVVGHDLHGYQMNVMADRLEKLDNRNFSKFGRLRRTEKKRLERSVFLGRLVCDIKISAKELIKSRSYDLDTLCQVVLKLQENQRMELEPEDIPKMYQTIDSLLKLISFTMLDTKYILKIMYDLNIIPLALQITNIAGNVMSKTLLGGRSERNEFLLLHAFSNKDYIVPDKEFKRKNGDKQTSKKTPTYSGGLVLEPKAGLYDTLILLMDFNSLYPSIIQEYNICFTTLPVTNSEDGMVLPRSDLPLGILPTEIRKLVESRRQVKSLMNSSDISNDLRMQYNIRQTALKLTANSMYGCLGFSHSRFYARNLAALVTQKGREILTDTKNLVEKMCYEVVYGDTDSIMINTQIDDYDQVFKIGLKIKQEVNKLYKQVELDIDGVFKSLLLLKKKKYAAVTMTKAKDGQLKLKTEYKGLDIVRRDWSQLACEAGKYILGLIFSDQPPDERITSIHNYLVKIREDLEQGRVPIPLLVITKQLTKNPTAYIDKNMLPHVQVALRYNKESGGHFRAGDVVPYVICEDTSGNSHVQRAYHVDELKNSTTLKIDQTYYLAQQIHPIVMRICEPIEGIDNFQIAECLGLDTSSLKKPVEQSPIQSLFENVLNPETKFKNTDQFKFICYNCKMENVVQGPLIGNVPFLEKCANSECNLRPVDYLPNIQNQLSLSVQSYIKKYYDNVLTCEDPCCPNETRRMPLKFIKKHPVCTLCQKGVMYKVYAEKDLYSQLQYFHYIFDPTKLSKRPPMEQEIESGYQSLRETVEKYLNQSAFSIVNLGELFSDFLTPKEDEVKLVEESEDEEFNEEWEI